MYCFYCHIDTILYVFLCFYLLLVLNYKIAVKSDLRTREMTDEWMNDRLVVYIEKDMLAGTDSEGI